MKRKLITRFIAGATLTIASLLSGCVTTIYEEPCSYGTNGRPGSAFFGIDWTVTAPSYVWTNNTAIPHVFQYGSYYYSAPGTFELYYEGSVIEDCCPKEYYWDVNFDIWTHPGSNGGCGFSGANGADSYLMLLADPYGPIENRMNRTTSENSAWEITSDDGTTTVAERTEGDVTVRITFTKLEESKKDKLDPDGIVIGSK